MIRIRRYIKFANDNGRENQKKIDLKIGSFRELDAVSQKEKILNLDWKICRLLIFQQNNPGYTSKRNKKCILYKFQLFFTDEATTTKKDYKIDNSLVLTLFKNISQKKNLKTKTNPIIRLRFTNILMCDSF